MQPLFRAPGSGPRWLGHRSSFGAAQKLTFKYVQNFSRYSQSGSGVRQTKLGVIVWGGSQQPSINISSSTPYWSFLQPSTRLPPWSGGDRTRLRCWVRGFESRFVETIFWLGGAQREPWCILCDASQHVRCCVLEKKNYNFFSSEMKTGLPPVQRQASEI